MRKLLKRLSGQGVLLSLFLVFTVPFIVVVHQLATEINDSQEFSAKERLGLRYSGGLRGLLEIVIEQQQQTEPPIDRQASAQMPATQAKLAAAIESMGAIDASLGARLNTTATWQQLQQAIQNFRQELPTLSVETRLQQQMALVQRLLALTAQVGDNSNLILDPDLDSYYLMAAIVTQLPQIIDHSFRARAIGSSIAQRQLMTLDDKVTLLGLANAITANLATMQRGTQVAYNANSSLTKLEPDFQRARRSSAALAKLIREMGVQQQPVTRAQVLAAGNRTLADQFKLYDSIAPELDKLLAARVEKDAGRQQRVKLFGLLVLIALLAIYTGFAANLLQRKRAQRQLSVQYSTASTLATALTLEAATPQVLQTIGSALGWDWGELWLLNPKTKTLEFVQSWHQASLAQSSFAGASQGLSFATDRGIVGRVWQTKEAIWVTDVGQEPSFLRAKAAAESGLHTAVSFPIFSGNQISGVMGFFSQRIQPLDRNLLQMMTTLGSQIGQFVKRQQIEAALQDIAQSVSVSGCDAFFRSLVQQLVSTLDLDYAIVGKVVGETQDCIETVAVCQQGEIVANFSYKLPQTPGENVVGKTLCYYPHQVRQQFPQDAWLAEMQVESYMGIPLFSAAGKTLGLLAVMGRQAIADPQLTKSTLKICATRAAAELERQQAEAQLRDHEALLRMSLSAARMGAWDWDIVNGNEQWSEEVTAIFGMAPGAQVSYESFFSRVHPDDKAKVVQAQNRALQDDVDYNLEYRIIWDDGSIRWISSNGRVTRDQFGTPLRLTGVTIDITERKRTEATLREQEALLQMSLSAARMGAWEWNVVTQKGKWSPEVAALYGLDHHSITNSRHEFLRHLHPDDYDRVMEVQRRALQEDAQYQLEYRIIWQDGSVHWIYSTGDVVRDDFGNPLLLTGINMDITDRKQAEAALQAAEEKYRSIFENAVDGIFQTTPAGAYISANPALAQIYGYDSPLDLMDSLSHRIDRQLYIDPHRRSEFISLMSQHEAVTDFESQIYRCDGSIIWISENARLVRDANGDPLYYEGIVKDISDRKQAAAELFRAKEAAEAANRAKSQFLANMSHELRTPLNAIIGYSEMLQEDADADGYAEIIPDLDKINAAGKHLLGLINDILDISKIEAGKMDLYLETFSIPALIQEVKATLQPLIEKNGNRLAIDCAPELGTMHADLTKVRQVLFNLLSNASKFTENGMITLTVEAAASRQKPDQPAAAALSLRRASELPQFPSTSLIRFIVTDTGIGMNPQQVTKLFQAFTQADASTTRKYGGTGLGLVISQRFCQMMGGTIAVVSQRDQGSTFTVELPIEVYDRQAELSALDEAVAATQPKTLNGMTILVIDDDPTVRDLMRRYLSKEGFRVETASNGQEGLHLARSLRPDAITLDVMMPKMDGWSVLATLKASPDLAEIPVVVLTIVDEKQHGFALGATDYLTKPIDYKRLASLLHKYRPTATAQLTEPIGQVLIAEDDLATQEMFYRILVKEGWQVVAVANGRAALQAIELQKPDLILLDLMMPEMDGFQFITELRHQANYRQIPIIVITAMDLTPAALQALNGYVEQILQKGSYQRDDLLQEVRDLVMTCIRAQKETPPHG